SGRRRGREGVVERPLEPARAPRVELGREQEVELPAHVPPEAARSAVFATDRRPSFSSSAASLFGSGLGVVSSSSPTKIEWAPARKQSACPSSLMPVRPALRRITASGIRRRATATVRTTSLQSSGALPSSGVPAIGTSELIGTLSGGGESDASSCSSS